MIINYDKITDFGLVNLAYNCPKLSVLDISRCSKVTISGLREFVDIITSRPSWESQPLRKLFVLRRGTQVNFSLKLNSIGFFRFGR